MGDGVIRLLSHPDGPYLLRQLAIAGRAGKRGAQRWEITLKTPMASIVGSTLAVALIPAWGQSNPPGMVTQMIVAGVVGEPRPPVWTTSDLCQRTRGLRCSALVERGLDAEQGMLPCSMARRRFAGLCARCAGSRSVRRARRIRALIGHLTHTPESASPTTDRTSVRALTNGASPVELGSPGNSLERSALIQRWRVTAEPEQNCDA